MAQVKLLVARGRRDFIEHNPDADSITVSSVKIGGSSGVEVTSTNMVTTDNEKTFTNKTMSGLSNTFTDIQGSSLSDNAKQAVLEFRRSAVWDRVDSFTIAASSATSNVTQAVTNAAAIDTAVTDNSAKGILMTGTGTGGAGSQNYMVQLRYHSSGDAINDAEDGSVWAELSNANAAGLTGTIAASTSSTTVTGTDTTFSTDFQVGDAVIVAGSVLGYVATINSNTELLLAANASATVSGATADRRRYTLTYKQLDGGAFTFTSETVVDFLFAEVFDYNDRPWRADLFGFGWADIILTPGAHNHSASDITSGTLSTDRFDAYADLVADSRIGTGSTQLAAGNHTHDVLNARRDYTAGAAIGAAGTLCYVSAEGVIRPADKDTTDIQLKRLVVAAASAASGAAVQAYYLPGTTIGALSGMSSISAGAEIYLGDDGAATQDLGGISTGKIIMIGHGVTASSWEFGFPLYVQSVS